MTEEESVYNIVVVRQQQLRFLCVLLCCCSITIFVFLLSAGAVYC